ncbi:MAG: phosphate acyltransferase PlsX [SAR202 cluster bacterium]|jgi:glycerol-3-phosphate acyltransferase PlsX|nr:phosphate acyltransferase PlsX [SAR202 cluster bacterium]|tara:strand:- start:1891 stop:2904 length:1014 start_codon:yes stop_codon:yes gene_type:complete
MNSKIKIAVDAMGGDNAPHEIVSGAVEASTTLDVEILLVGDPEKLITELKKHTYSNDKISIIPSEDVILESDKPALALRQKPKASILVATSLVKKGLANASVTMGSTGAAMASAAVILGVIENVERPSLGGPILGLAPKTTIIDVGTNIDCKPSQILSFAIIGHVYAKVFWNLSKPRIALLSVGAEENKGNKLIQESKNLLNDSPLNFIGNIEANDLTNNIADVVVCDGFVGNIVMKLTEGLGKSIAEYLSENLKGKLPDEELNHLKNQIYELNNVVEVNGGGPILGVKGVSVVGHGRGNSKSVFNAIKSAKQTVEINYIEKLNQELSQIHNTLKNE